jgi:hypothetical protein
VQECTTAVRSEADRAQASDRQHPRSSDRHPTGVQPVSSVSRAATAHPLLRVLLIDRGTDAGPDRPEPPLPGGEAPSSATPSHRSRSHYAVVIPIVRRERLGHQDDP